MTKQLMYLTSAIIIGISASNCMAGFVSGAIASGDLTSVIQNSTVVDFENSPVGTFSSQLQAGGVSFRPTQTSIVSAGFSSNFNNRGQKYLQTLGVIVFEFSSGPVNEFAFLLGNPSLPNFPPTASFLLQVFSEAPEINPGGALEEYSFSLSRGSNAGDYVGIRRATNDIRFGVLYSHNNPGGNWQPRFDNLTYAANGQAPQAPTSVPEPFALGIWGMSTILIAANPARTKRGRKQ